MRQYKKIDEQDINKIREIVGENNIITEQEKMLDYSHDEFSLAKITKIPDAVAKPRSAAEVSEILKLANKESVPVTPRGGGTGLCGGCVPVFGGVVLSFENMNKLLEIDCENLMAVAEPGLTLKEFYENIEKAGFFFPPHPGEESATIGGVVATNAGGARAVKYGVIRNFIRGLEVSLPTGEIINLCGKIIKNSTGYNLLNLLIGSEGTLGIVTKAVISLMPPPAATIMLVVPYDNLSDAIKTVPEIIRNKIMPMAVEFIERELITVTEEFLRKEWPCKGGEAHLMIILDGSSEEEMEKLSQSIAQTCLDYNATDVFVANTMQKQQDVMDIRSQIYEALKPQTIEALDITVPRAEIANHVEKVHEISKKYGMWLPTCGHAADGNLHTFLMKTCMKDRKLDDAEIEGWKEKYPLVRKELHEDCKMRGGIISGEHGIGLVKKEYLPLSVDRKQIELMKMIKKIFDPNKILNPGKIFDID